MKILMVTNTYAPHVGGVARSVESFSERFRELGHRVVVVCPSFDNAASTRSVLRVPAIEHFRHTEFSLPLPLPTSVHRAVQEFQPDVVHSHHPFLLGDTALRIGAELGIPVVLTHHNQYDKYSHYVGEDELGLTKRFIEDLDTGYCNLCDAVVTPSMTVAEDLRIRGVETRTEVIPSGVDLSWFGAGPRHEIRQEFGVPEKSFVVGHVGRLAPEKNLSFVAESVATSLQQNAHAWFVVAGVGPSVSAIKTAFEKHGLTDRLLMVGVLNPIELRNFYHVMDVFVFGSKADSQALVLAEAMAAGVPVVALETPGSRDIIENRVNGLLVNAEDTQHFANAINWISDLDEANRSSMKREIPATISKYSLDHTSQQLLELYAWVRKLKSVVDPEQMHNWRTKVNRVEQELNIWGNFAHALGDTMVSTVRGKVF